MKKIIISILISMISFSVSADVIVKYGMVVSDKDEPGTLTWVGIWGETNNCDYCVALFALETYQYNDHPRDRMVGVDYAIKSLENSDGALRINLGFAIADGVLQGGEEFNFHLGLSFEAKKVFFNKYSLLLSYDHFSNGKTLFNREDVLINEPLDLMSVGIGF